MDILFDFQFLNHSELVVDHLFELVVLHQQLLQPLLQLFHLLRVHPFVVHRLMQKVHDLLRTAVLMHIQIVFQLGHLSSLQL